MARQQSPPDPTDNEALERVDPPRLRALLLELELDPEVRDLLLGIGAADWRRVLYAEGMGTAVQVADITKHLDLSDWPAETRAIAQREASKPHSQLNLFAPHDGRSYRVFVFRHNQEFDRSLAAGRCSCPLGVRCHTVGLLSNHGL